MKMAEERNFFRPPGKCPKEVLQFDRYPEYVTSGHPSGRRAPDRGCFDERSAAVRRYSHSGAVAIFGDHSAVPAEGADVLQTERQTSHQPQSDPVRTALLVAAALATLLVGVVAVKAIFSNNQQELPSIQAPR
jgi:hypothetical protein